MKVYFDYNATSPLHPEVLAQMKDVLENFIGNPSSVHTEGRAARDIVENSRKKLAHLINAQPEEIIFTSGGTESNNTALIGFALSWLKDGHKPFCILASPLEHPSIIKPLEFLKKIGFDVSFIQVDNKGRIIEEHLIELLKQKNPMLVTLSLCNHELGNLYPIKELTSICHQYGALVHTDAAQAIGKTLVDTRLLEVDLLSISGHKFQGPKGIGALYISNRLKQYLPSINLLYGGGQEKGRRAGTENLASIAGMGLAASIAQTDFSSYTDHVKNLRDYLEKELLTIPGSTINGDPENRVPGTCNIHFEDVEGELLHMNLDIQGISIATGSACSSGSTDPSSVLLAIGQSPKQAKQSVRFSLGRQNTLEEVVYVIEQTKQAIARVRKVNSLFASIY